jgi:DNA adenine methylase
MAVTNTPLRYPGGKSSITPFLRDVIKLNDIEGGTYIEPYAGGAGAALNLLMDGTVSELVINDFDPCIYSFWQSILFHTEDFVDRVRNIPLVIDEWRVQKQILLQHEEHDLLDVGFAAFYLNRCNRSGILKAGPIGGQHQAGDYTLDVRFNRLNLEEKIERIASFREQITVHNLDAIDLMQNVVPDIDPPALVYLDPPYYEKGHQLYLNAYEHRDHEDLAHVLETETEGILWVLTYDNTPHVRDLYPNSIADEYLLNYFAHHARRGSELLITPPGLLLPKEMQITYGLS